MTNAQPAVLILCGSESDVPRMREAAGALDELGIAWELRVSSAHRALDRTVALAREARARGIRVIIAGAGLAAHLPGVVAGCTTLPVIGVPLSAGALSGTDALHAVVQMPPGIPVATVAIDGARNAGLLAAQLIALADDGIAERLEDFRDGLVRKVEQADARVQEQLAGAPPGALVGT